MTVRRGEIYNVDFSPARGSEQGGIRPALIIQNDLGNQHSSTTIVAALTSRQKQRYPFHVEFSADESGMDRDGTALLEQLLTVSKDRLSERRGELPAPRMAEVDAALKRSLALR